MVLPAARAVSPLVTGGQTTVALRVLAHPVFQSVLRQFGQGLAAPSANPFGQISLTTAAHVQHCLAGSRQWSMAGPARSVLNPPSWISAATVPAFCGLAWSPPKPSRNIYLESPPSLPLRLAYRVRWLSITRHASRAIGSRLTSPSRRSAIGGWG